MANDDERAGISVERLHQPIHRRNIQVIRRLIQQKKLRHRVSEQNRRQRGTKTLTPGKLPNTLMHALAPEQQPRQLVAKMLFTRPRVRPLHGFKEGTFRIKRDALRQIRGVVQAVKHPVSRRYGGAVVGVIRVRYRVEKHGLAAAVRSRNAQMLGPGQDKSLGKVLAAGRIINFIRLCFM